MIAALPPLDLIALKRHANIIRRETFIIGHRVKHGHLGSSLSPIDLLSALYFWFLRVDPNNPTDPARDRFILSKGHACLSLFISLWLRGFFDKTELNTFLQDGSLFAGHAHHHLPGVEASTGSLGHGLSLATGMAYAGRTDNATHRVVAILSDGECDEGSTWEAALFAGHHKLDNLIIIVDYNKLQAYGFTKEVLDLEPFAQKWESFGWAVREINGHDLMAITGTLAALPFTPGKPSVVIAHTVKGKGLPLLENTVASHYLAPSDEQLKEALEAVEAERVELESSSV